MTRHGFQVLREVQKFWETGVVLMIKRVDYVHDNCATKETSKLIPMASLLYTIAKSHHLADLKVKVSLVSASLGRTIRASNSSASRLVTAQTNLLTIEGVAIDSVDRVVSNAIAVGSTPNELGGVGRVVVCVFGETKAVALADDGSAEVATVGCDLHLRGLLAGPGGGEEDVLVAVVFDSGVAGEGGGGEGEDAGDEDGGVHGCGCFGWLVEEWIVVDWLVELVFVAEDGR